MTLIFEQDKILQLVYQIKGQALMDNWRLANDFIVRNVKDSADRFDRSIEMSGRMVSVLVHYGPSVPRMCLVFPYYHTGHEWGDLLKTDCEPRVKIELATGAELLPSQIEHISFNGIFRAAFSPTPPLTVTTTVFPSTRSAAVFCVYELRNTSSSRLRGAISIVRDEDKIVETIEGSVTLSSRLLVRSAISDRIEFEIEGSSTLEFAYVTQLSDGEPSFFDIRAEMERRQELMELAASRAEFASEHEEVDFMYRLAKLRAIESVFDTQIGPMHSPGGGGGFYGGIWCNDQAEYAFPLFPYLGVLNDVAIHDYELLASKMDEAGRLPHSVEFAGLYLGPLERGDGAMYAYGASLFLLGLADMAVVERLLPHIERAIDFELAHMDERGIVHSETDELEDRYPTGDANLSTNVLFYAGLRYASELEELVGHADRTYAYREAAIKLHADIERHFGANIEGYDAYRYYEGNDKLRGWICLPLTMGILERAKAVRDALLSKKLWSEHGLRVVSDKDNVWERETMYAIRGLFMAGFAEDAGRKLIEVSHRHTSGDSAPYIVEQSPSFTQLAAESALFVRIITEGLFGIEPHFDKVIIRPKLPGDWRYARIRDIRLHSSDMSVNVERRDGVVHVLCEVNGEVEHDGPLPPSGEIVVPQK